MKGVPPEIDALMWQLAEEGGPVAQSEFEHRYVRYGPELTRRIRMVAELRAAGKSVAHRPTFTPRPVRVASAPRWVIAAVAGMAVFAVGAVAYLAASADERPTASKPASSVLPKVPTIEVEQPVVNVPPVVRKEPTPPVADPKPTKPARYLQAQDVQMSDTQLTAAIKLVAVGGGLDATIAPGFQEQTVSFDYRGAGLNTLQILKAMGEQYGFSVLEEEEGRLLIIPARADEPSTRRIGS